MLRVGQVVRGLLRSWGAFEANFALEDSVRTFPEKGSFQEVRGAFQEIPFEAPQTFEKSFCHLFQSLP